MSQISIRPARAGDADAIKHLLDRSWRSHWAPHLGPAATVQYDAVQPVAHYVDNYGSQLTVAERGGVVVGMYHLEGPMLHAMHVDSWAIGTGIGRAMMEAAELAGARRLEVRAFNLRARRFYAGRGWIEVDEHEGSEMGMPVRTIVMERV